VSAAGPACAGTAGSAVTSTAVQSRAPPSRRRHRRAPTCGRARSCRSKGHPSASVSVNFSSCNPVTRNFVYSVIMLPASAGLVFSAMKDCVLLVYAINNAQDNLLNLVRIGFYKRYSFVVGIFFSLASYLFILHNNHIDVK